MRRSLPTLLIAALAAPLVSPAFAAAFETPLRAAVRSGEPSVSLYKPAEQRAAAYTRMIEAYDGNPADFPLYLAQFYRRAQAYESAGERAKDPKERRAFFEKAAADQSKLIAEHARWEKYDCGSKQKDYFTDSKLAGLIDTPYLPCGQAYSSLVTDEIGAGRFDDALQTAADGLKFVQKQTADGRLTEDLTLYWVHAFLVLTATSLREKGRLDLEITAWDHVVEFDEKARKIPGANPSLEEYQDRYSRGLALILAARMDEGVTDLATACREIPSDRRNYAGNEMMMATLGRVLMVNGKNEEALPWLSRAIEAWSHDGNLYRLRAVAYARSGRRREALRDLDSSGKKFSPSTLDTRGLRARIEAKGPFVLSAEDLDLPYAAGQVSFNLTDDGKWRRRGYSENAVTSTVSFSRELFMAAAAKKK